MVTAPHDHAKYASLTPAERARRGWNGFPIPTNFCHTCPPSTNWDLELIMNEPGHPKATYAGHVCNLIYAFGDIRFLDELNGDTNGLTLATYGRQIFDSLNLWFEGVPNGPPNTYLVRSMQPVLQAATTPITFTSTSPSLDLPDPRYLGLHAAVCRVAHMSGAAEYLDQLDRDIEPMTVLAQDGSSSKLLNSRLENLVL